MSKGKLALRIAGGVALAGLAYLSLVITPFGHRSVIWSVGGVSYEEREPGLSFVVPLVQRYHPVDVREQRYVTVDLDGKSNAYVQSSDLQEITVRGTIIFRVQPDLAAELYDEVGPDFTMRVVEPIFFDAIKEAAGQVPAEAFAQELGSLAENIEAIVTPQLAKRGIDVRSVLLEDAVFDPEFVQSVKNKVIALQREQETETLERVAANEAEAIRQVGGAEAEVQQKLAEAVSPETVCYELAKQGVRCVPDVVAGDAPLIYDLGQP